MGDQQMKIGVWFYGLGTALTGTLDLAWGAFDASHQPIKALGKDLPGQHILACIPGVWLIAAGLAILWRRSARIGAAAAASAYLIFVALWLPRYAAGVHVYGWGIGVLLGITFGLAQQVFLVAPATIVFASTAAPDSPLQKRAGLAARWMLGLPPVFFGLLHLAGKFLGALTGVAFILAGGAICFGIMDVLALRLLALMLLLFEGLVEIPPIFIRLHNQATWGAAAYNLAAIGACWIFAEFLASSADRGRIEPVGSVAASRPDPLVARSRNAWSSTTLGLLPSRLLTSGG